MPLTFVKLRCLVVSAILILGLSYSGITQVVIKGVVKDVHSDERVPFASLQLKKSGSGNLTDSAGHFILRLSEWPRDNDTLEVTYVGYQDYLLPIDSSVLSKAVNNVLELDIYLERGKYAS